MDGKNLFEEVIVPIDVWERLMQIGAGRTQQKRLYQTSEYLHPQSHEMGVVGEWHVATLMGLKHAKDVSVFGDDGSDLPGNIDVKCAEYYGDPWLKVRVEKATPGRRFALVAVNLARRAVRYFGYITSEELKRVCRQPERIQLRSSRSTSVTGLKRDDSEGPESYVLRDRSKLTRALPPIL